jgi:hypothetical protein
MYMEVSSNPAGPCLEISQGIKRETDFALYCKQADLHNNLYWE